MKLIFTLVFLLLPCLSFAELGWERVTSESQLAQKNYMYKIVMWQPTRQGTWAVNMYEPSNGSNVYMWKDKDYDTDQIFRLTGKHIKRDRGQTNDNSTIYTDYCLNAYKPKKGRNVNAWKCDYTDSDQYWSYKIVGEYSEYVMIEASNSGYCLNAYQAYYYSNLNLYPCNNDDNDQWFSIFRVWGD
jgi:hypothetical protein